VHRQLADGDAWFLVNRRNRDEAFEAHFRVTGKQPELWHADSGKVEPVSWRSENGETIVPLSLPAESSVFVVFRKPATTTHGEVRAVHDVPLGTLGAATGSTRSKSRDAGWMVAFQAGRGAPASLAMPTLARLDQNAAPGVRYFSGMATYARSFRLPKGWKKGQPLWLDLGEVHDIAQVTVNGQDLGTQWHAPYRFDLGSAVHNGTNAIQVRVANSWVNRLIGDAQPGATKVTWTAIPPTMPMRRCGRRAWLARSRWARPAEPVAATGHSALSPPLPPQGVASAIDNADNARHDASKIWWCCATVGKDAQEWASNFCPPWRLLRWGPAWGRLRCGRRKPVPRR
jgi:hypothetical protein